MALVKAATETCFEDKKTLSAASKTDLYVAAVNSLLLMWARTFTGNWRLHKARAAAAQQHPASLFGFLQMSSTI